MKIKNNKSAVKRIKIKKKLMYRKKAGTNHFLSKKSSKILRRLSKTIIINKSNKKSFLKLIPKFK